jgi:hypothetical protein
MMMKQASRQAGKQAVELPIPAANPSCCPLGVRTSAAYNDGQCHVMVSAWLHDHGWQEACLSVLRTTRLRDLSACSRRCKPLLAIRRRALQSLVQRPIDADLNLACIVRECVRPSLIL